MTHTTSITSNFATVGMGLVACPFILECAGLPAVVHCAKDGSFAS